MSVLARVLLLAMLVAGCSRTNFADVIKAFAADPNGWCARDNLGTVYGTNTGFIGRGGPNTSVKITADACEITGSGVHVTGDVPGTLSVTPPSVVPIPSGPGPVR